MQSFMQKHEDAVIGTLSGFDRLVLRGTLRSLAYAGGMMKHLAALGVLLKNFGEYAQSVTEQLKRSVTEVAVAAGRPVRYLASSRTSKEQVARAIAATDTIQEGLICILTCVEPCVSYEIYRDKEAKLLRLKPRYRKCLFLYAYHIHPQVGFMNARIQSWFPFSVQVCINGREWLARQMDEAGLQYSRRDNCFPWVEDFAKAQSLFEQQLKVHWRTLLDDIVRLLHPNHNKLFARFPVQYYWSVHQSEWATDIMFDSSESLAARYPQFLRHAIATFASPDVMRFLGHRVPETGNLHPNFAGEVVSDIRTRPEGVRIKHRVKANSIKLYDKQGSVLRTETTINDPTDFRVFRPCQGENSDPDWRPMRKGVADIHRRAHVSHAANVRYLEALASIDATSPLSEITDTICRPTTYNGRRVRALHPHSPEDAALLAAVSRGEFAINGFRNRDIRCLLYPGPCTIEEKRRRSARVTRQLRMLRAHGLIKKVPRTHRYVTTARGRIAITALVSARNADTQKLTKLAA